MAPFPQSMAYIDPQVLHIAEIDFPLLMFLKFASQNLKSFDFEGGLCLDIQWNCELFFNFHAKHFLTII